MNIETLAIGRLQTNCCLVWDPDAGEGIIIDPGDAAEFIAERVQSLNFTPSAIVATHGHFDHNLAAGELQLMLRELRITNNELRNDAPYCIHKADLFLLKEMNKSARHWLGATDERPLPETITYLKKGDTLKVGKYNLKVIETPGHTPGSVCLFSDYITPGVEEPFDKAQGGKTPGVERQMPNTKYPPASPAKRGGRGQILFSGDTLFCAGIGRYDFSYSSRGKLDSSLKRLMKLPKQTIVYPGHGESTTIGDERDNLLDRL